MSITIIEYIHSIYIYVHNISPFFFLFLGCNFCSLKIQPFKRFSPEISQLQMSIKQWKVNKKIQKVGKLLLVGGFDPFVWNICSSNWIISPNRGENRKYLKPPPRLTIHSQIVEVHLNECHFEKIPKSGPSELFSFGQSGFRVLTNCEHNINICQWKLQHTPISHTPGNNPFANYDRNPFYSLLIMGCSGCVPVRCVKPTFESGWVLIFHPPGFV